LGAVVEFKRLRQRSTTIPRPKPGRGSEPIQASDVVAVRARIAELTVQWSNIAVGESMKLVF
jgi:hypothetical protein